MSSIPDAPQRCPWALAIVFGKLLLHLFTIGLYDFHRDEIYLLVCGRHLGWGSPDHAPLAPALSWLLGHLPNQSVAASLTGQRVVAALAGTATVWWTARLTRRLGGNRNAQRVAAASALIAPALLFQSGVYTTGTLDALCWIAACDLTAAAMRSHRAPSWLLAGGALGLGLLAKYTAVLCGAGLAIGLCASSEREQLRRSGPWLALGVAVVVVLPNLLWQATHALPALRFAVGSHASIVLRFSRLEVLAVQPMIMHPFSFVVTVIGLATALRLQGVERVFGILFLFTLAIVVVVPGKPHYVMPAYLPLIAIGARSVAAWLERRSKATRVALTAGWFASGAVAFLLTVPVLPLPTLLHLRVDRINSEVVQFADWRAVAAEVRRAQSSVGRPLPVLTDSYGTAAAIELYGPPLLPPWSGANSFYLRLPTYDPNELIAAGYPEPLLDALCGRRTAVGKIVSPSGLDNRYDFPRTIWLCTDLRSSLRAFWPRLRRFD